MLLPSSAKAPSLASFRYLGALLAIIAAKPGCSGCLPASGLWRWWLSALLGSVYIHYAQQARLNRKLSLAQEEVEHTGQSGRTGAHRARPARPAGHTLSVIVLKSSWPPGWAKGPQRAMPRFGDVEPHLAHALAQVRSAVRAIARWARQRVEPDPGRRWRRGASKVEAASKPGRSPRPRRASWRWPVRESHQHHPPRPGAHLRLGLRSTGRAANLENRRRWARPALARERRRAERGWAARRGARRLPRDRRGARTTLRVRLPCRRRRRAEPHEHRW